VDEGVQPVGTWHSFPQRGCSREIGDDDLRAERAQPVQPIAVTADGGDVVSAGISVRAMAEPIPPVAPVTMTLAMTAFLQGTR
jgi:hypothetical protein